MTTEVLTHTRGVLSLDDLQRALTELLADAGDDRIAEGGDRRVDASEVYLNPLVIDLIRERLTDGSHVYNLRIRNGAP